MIVLDTNVVSELMRPEPSEAVLTWLAETADSRRATTAVTVAELRFGIARLPEGGRRRALAVLADDVLQRFGEQVLPFDLAAAPHYAALVAHRERSGRPIHTADAQIAAITRTHGATLATRNIADFEDIGLPLVDPWTANRIPGPP